MRAGAGAGAGVGVRAGAIAGAGAIFITPLFFIQTKRLEKWVGGL